MLENFRLALKFQGVTDASWRGQAMHALSAVDMTQFANHYPKQLSGGMKQRINLARGLCVGTQVLLLDEPFAALDERTAWCWGKTFRCFLRGPEKQSCLSPIPCRKRSFSPIASSS